MRGQQNIRTHLYMWGNNAYLRVTDIKSEVARIAAGLKFCLLPI